MRADRNGTEAEFKSGAGAARVTLLSENGCGFWALNWVVASWMGICGE